MSTLDYKSFTERRRPHIHPAGATLFVTYRLAGSIPQAVVRAYKAKRDWLENELENVFAKDPAKRFGGWLVRFKGLAVTFTARNRRGERVRAVKINGQPVVLDRRYSMLGCEREGDPDNVVCRLPNVADARTLNVSVHDVLTEYLSTHSPVAPAIEGRAVATDEPAVLLSQLEGTNYRFR